MKVKNYSVSGTNSKFWDLEIKELWQHSWSKTKEKEKKKREENMSPSLIILSLSLANEWMCVPGYEKEAMASFRTGIFNIIQFCRSSIFSFLFLFLNLLLSFFETLSFFSFLSHFSLISLSFLSFSLSSLSSLPQRKRN